MVKDWTNIYKKYKGQWVALKKDEETVIVSRKTLKQTITAAKEKGYNEPIMTRMPEKLVPYVGLLL